MLSIFFSPNDTAIQTQYDLTVLNQFIAWVSTTPLPPNTQQDAIKILESLRWIKVNKEGITKFINHKETYINKLSSRDQKNGVVRDHKNTSIHFNSYQNGEKAISELLQIVNIFETTFINLVNTNQLTLLCFLAKCNYDQEVGCMEARIASSMEFIGVIQESNGIIPVEVLLQLCQLLYFINIDNDTYNFVMAERFLSPYYGQSVLVSGLAVTLTPELVFQYMSDYLDFENPRQEDFVAAKTLQETFPKAWQKQIFDQLIKKANLVYKDGVYQYRFADKKSADQFSLWLRRCECLQTYDIYRCKTKEETVSQTKIEYVVRLYEIQFESLMEADSTAINNFIPLKQVTPVSQITVTSSEGVTETIFEQGIRLANGSLCFLPNPDLVTILEDNDLASWDDFNKLKKYSDMHLDNKPLHNFIDLMEKYKTHKSSSLKEIGRTSEVFRNGLLLVKIFSGWLQPKAWNGFVEQLKNPHDRAILRKHKSPIGSKNSKSYKLCHTTNEIDEYNGNRVGPKLANRTHAKKTSMTLMDNSTTRTTFLFGEQYSATLLVGVAVRADPNIATHSIHEDVHIKDSAKIQAMLLVDSHTFGRQWIGSEEEVKNYARRMEGINFTSLKEFQKAISNSTFRTNEVLAKPSKESLLGIVIGRDTPEARELARRYQKDIQRELDIKLPIIMYDKKGFIEDLELREDVNSHEELNIDPLKLGGLIKSSNDLSLLLKKVRFSEYKTIYDGIRDNFVNLVPSIKELQNVCQALNDKQRRVFFEVILSELPNLVFLNSTSDDLNWLLKELNITFLQNDRIDFIDAIKDKLPAIIRSCNGGDMFFTLAKMILANPKLEQSPDLNEAIKAIKEKLLQSIRTPVNFIFIFENFETDKYKILCEMLSSNFAMLVPSIKELQNLCQTFNDKEQRAFFEAFFRELPSLVSSDSTLGDLNWLLKELNTAFSQNEFIYVMDAIKDKLPAIIKSCTKKKTLVKLLNSILAYPKLEQNPDLKETIKEKLLKVIRTKDNFRFIFENFETDKYKILCEMLSFNFAMFVPSIKELRNNFRNLNVDQQKAYVEAMETHFSRLILSISDLKELFAEEFDFDKVPGEVLKLLIFVFASPVIIILSVVLFPVLALEMLFEGFWTTLTVVVRVIVDFLLFMKPDITSLVVSPEVRVIITKELIEKYQTLIQTPSDLLKVLKLIGHNAENLAVVLKAVEEKLPDFILKSTDKNFDDIVFSVMTPEQCAELYTKITGKQITVPIDKQFLEGIKSVRLTMSGAIDPFKNTHVNQSIEDKQKVLKPFIMRFELALVQKEPNELRRAFDELYQEANTHRSKIGFFSKGNTRSSEQLLNNLSKMKNKHIKTLYGALGLEFDERKSTTKVAIKMALKTYLLYKPDLSDSMLLNERTPLLLQNSLF